MKGLTRARIPEGAVVTRFGAVAVGDRFRFVYGEGALNAGINGGPEGRTVSGTLFAKVSPRRFVLAGTDLTAAGVMGGFSTGATTAVVVVEGATS